MLKMIAAALALLAGPAFADEAIPFSALQPYETFREAMVSAGWSPVDARQDGNGPVDEAGRYPELTCSRGAVLDTWCWAIWSQSSSSVPVKVYVEYSEDDPRHFRIEPAIAALN